MNLLYIVLSLKIPDLQQEKVTGLNVSPNYVTNGNRRIAPTQTCTHEIKNVFMMLFLGRLG